MRKTNEAAPDPARTAASVRLFYQARSRALAAQARQLDTRSRQLSWARGLSFLAALGLAGWGLFRTLPRYGWGAVGASGLAFLAAVVAHGLVAAREAEVHARQQLGSRALARLAGRVPECLPGAEGAAPTHPYAADLDVYGPAALCTLLDETRTEPGTSTLGRWLREPASCAEVVLRQAAVRDLCARQGFREDLATLGELARTRAKPVLPLLEWAEQQAAFQHSWQRWLARLAFGLVPTTLALVGLRIGLGPGLPVPLAKLALATLAAQGAVLVLLVRTTEQVLGRASAKQGAFGRFRTLFARIERESFAAPHLVELSQKLKGKPTASLSYQRFERLLSFAELRHGGGIVYLLINWLLLWDVFCALALERFRTQQGSRLRGWCEALGELEALSCLAGFAFEQPEYCYPTLVEGPSHFQAEGLGHPLIPTERRVANDVRLPEPGTGLLITGSNMSGKSTLLRSIGLGAVLAQAGAPVCARSLTMTPLRVWTSMRLGDSLERGVSRFYAELERLKGVVDAANDDPRVLFLLDEVLHGTNSRERHEGGRAITEHLLKRGAIGAVTSHDVALADLEATTQGRMRNVHFEEQLDGETMSFDYRLKPGVVATSNALRLMKLVGVAIEWPAAEP